MAEPKIAPVGDPPSADPAHDFRKLLTEAIPSLRAFAISLSSRTDFADDLVQETLMKAWNHQDTFKPGTNLRAWLYTILRNEYYSVMRKRRREVEDANDFYAGQLAVPGGQEGHIDIAELRSALMKLPDDQREAIILVGASGFSYQEAAEICGVAMGTVKSRVSRARTRLALILEGGHRPGETVPKADDEDGTKGS
ncbi:MAG: sigma-70 family RNA polymerase sigma factor [Hyphomicrobiales bacterium]